MRAHSSSPDRLTVLVTGADQHQGLAIIRGLGLGGAAVIACGPHRRSLGFYSRYADASFTYTSPFRDRAAFIDDILDIVRRTRPTLILPGVESTLVALDACRERIEREVTLAAPSSAAFAFAIDKCETVRLAERLCVPVPRTIGGGSVESILDQAVMLRFPVAIKPRGSSLYATTTHALEFKVRYARTLDDLRRVLAELGAHSGVPLVQEYARGRGLCVDVVARHGVPIAMFAYAKSREVPLSGGVSVVRETVPLDERVERYVTALCSELRWHGIAMVEFKHDAIDDRYTLMEINGRFSAATALSLDAGLNLPDLVARLYSGGALPDARPPYTLGVRERWLSGDLTALRDRVMQRRNDLDATPPSPLPSKGRAIRAFVADFRRGMKYDEFKWWDWKPSVVESAAIGTLLAGWARSVIVGAVKTVLRGMRRAD